MTSSWATKTLGWLAGMALGLSFGTAWGQFPVMDLSMAGSYPIAAYAEVLEDPDGNLTFTQVSSPEYVGRFQPPQKMGLNFGLAQHPHWIRWRAANRSSENLWTLRMALPHLSKVNLYIRSPRGAVQAFRSGVGYPFEDRPLKTPSIVFPFSLMNGEEVEIYLRAESAGDWLELDGWVESNQAFYSQSFWENMAMGAFYGLMAVMALYSLFVYWQLHDRIYLYYTGAILLLGLGAFVQDGYAYALLWPDKTEYTIHAMMGLNTLFMGVLIMFSREFLATKINHPKLDPWLGRLAWLWFLGTAGVLTDWWMARFGHEMVLLPGLWATVIMLLGVMVLGGMSVAHGHRPARYFMAAKAGFVTFHLVFLFGMMGVIPFHFMILQMFKIGGALETVLFSLALAGQVNLARAGQALAVRAARTAQVAANNHLKTLWAQADENEELRRTQALLVKAKEQAEAATQTKDKFVSLVAHDLRAPMSAILGLASTLDMEPEHPLSPHQKETLGRVMTRTNHFIHMVEALLSLNRLQTGSIVPEKKWFNAKETLEEVGFLGFMAQEKGVTLHMEMEDGVRMYGDPALVFELAQNLVTNAIKFSSAGGQVWVKASNRHPGCLTVEDNGLGIAPERIPNLFRHDVKTSTPGTAGEPGTGLGLPLCHEIVAAHGGTLSVDSHPGKGTVFTVFFPPPSNPSNP
ncbi:MAG: sensor histidine kinase [Deltaproteobacteria bacterium]|nr:sensor histidine kinase [Deltaproteobacteria bacterium]